MYVLSFGGCGDRDRLNLYAELLTDQDAVPAFQSILANMEEMFKSDDDEISFSKMLAEAGMKDDTAYQPQDTIVFIMDDYSSEDTPDVKVLAPVGEEVSVGAVMLNQEHHVEILRNEELVFAY